MNEAPKHTPSERAMRAAVEMEIHAACSTTTRAKAEELDNIFPAYDDMLAALIAQEAADEANEVRLNYTEWQALEDKAKALRIAAISKAEGPRS